MSDDLETLVPAWLTLPEAAEQLGVSVNKVGRLLRDRELIAIARGTPRSPHVPAAFIVHGHVLKGLPGTLTVLHDAGYGDEESVRWLFSPDEGVGGTPIDALAQNRGKEVRRRAQALAL